MLTILWGSGFRLRGTYRVHYSRYIWMLGAHGFHRRSVDNDTATRIVLRLIGLGFRVGGLGLRACGSGAWLLPAQPKNLYTRNA